MAEGSHQRWNPWRALRSRTHIDLHHDDLPDGVHGLYGTSGGLAVIILDRDLTYEERRAVLAHELVHDERGGGLHHPAMPDGWSVIIAREERIVDRIAAERLVPLDELADLVDRLDTHDVLEAHDVAVHFDVPIAVAEVAMRLLRDRRPDAA